MNISGKLITIYTNRSLKRTGKVSLQNCRIQSSDVIVKDPSVQHLPTLLKKLSASLAIAFFSQFMSTFASFINVHHEWLIRLSRSAYRGTVLTPESFLNCSCNYFSREGT